MSHPFRFTEEQERFFSIWDQGVSVLAGAGSGKSTALVEKCARLLLRNPNARFCAVSFTEKSARDLEEKLSMKLGLLPSEIRRRHGVGTIHQLCLRIAHENAVAAGLEGQERVLDGTESSILWNQALDSLWSGRIPMSMVPALERLLERETRMALSDAISQVKRFKHLGGNLPKAADSSLLDLWCLSELVMERYSRLKRAREAIDYDDMEKAADLALSNEKVRKKYHQRFDLVLVDEAQDTSPVQARILERFAKPGFSNVCWIGDPKQSIYGFRDADVKLFEEISDRMKERIFFTKNFRSRPGILKFTNEVFHALFQGNSLRYEPLVPIRSPSESIAPVEGVWVKTPNDLAHFLKAEEEKGIPLDSMVLLLRTVSGKEKWLKALEEGGIRLSISGGGPFWKDPRVKELVAFLRAWAMPSNALSMAVFLRAPWVGVSDVQIDVWARAGKDAPSLLESFLKSDHPLAIALAPHWGTMLSPAELLLKLLEFPKVEEELGAQALGLWHRAENFRSQGMGFLEIVKNFSDAVKRGKKEPEIPPPNAKGVLPVSTIHASKGLEYPHVILIDFEEKVRAPNAPLVFFDREKGIHLGRRDEFGERTKDDPEEKVWREHALEKERKERLRLFYVALTRARERVVLVVPKSEEKQESAKKKKEKEPKDRIDQRIDWRSWILGQESSQSLIQWREISPWNSNTRNKTQGMKDEKSQPEIRATQPRFTRPRISVTELVKFDRCPRLLEWSLYRPRGKPTTLPLDSDDASELGTEIHQALEDDDEARLLEIEKKWGKNRIDAEVLLKWKQGSQWMAKGEKSFRELGFEIPVFKNVLVGAIDRLWEKNGKFTVLDYKIIGRMRESSALIEAYQMPLSIYVWAISKLEPTAKVPALARLIAISPEGVFEVPVPVWSFQETEAHLKSLLNSLQEVLEGKAGEAKPGAHCSHCPFSRGMCDAYTPSICG